MAMNKKIPKNIDDYVDRFPKEVQQLLQKMCLTIKKAAPKAKETISYGMLTFTLDGCFQRSVSVQVFPMLVQMVRYAFGLLRRKVGCRSDVFSLGFPRLRLAYRPIWTAHVNQTLRKTDQHPNIKTTT